MSAKAELRSIYAELPTIECQRRCQESCRQTIVIPEIEMARITAHAGDRPVSNGDHCPLLSNDGRCTAHAVRPIICRLWGVVESMRCPFGCEPRPRELTVEEGIVFFLRVALRPEGGRLVSTREEVEALMASWPPAVRQEMIEIFRRGGSGVTGR